MKKHWNRNLAKFTNFIKEITLNGHKIIDLKQLDEIGAKNSRVMIDFKVAVFIRLRSGKLHQVPSLFPIVATI